MVAKLFVTGSLIIEFKFSLGGCTYLAGSAGFAPSLNFGRDKWYGNKYHHLSNPIKSGQPACRS
jgi:hypothetical protein